MFLGGSRFGFLGGSCAIIVEGRRELRRVIANLNLVFMACFKSSTTPSRKQEYVLIFFLDRIGSVVRALSSVSLELEIIEGIASWHGIFW